MTLASLRKQWEKTLVPQCEIDRVASDGNFLAVLLDKRGMYHCHRYFPICSDWEVSVDARAVTIDIVWKWLANPIAIRSEEFQESDEEEECKTCIGHGRIEDGEDGHLRKCGDCNGSGKAYLSRI